MSLSVKIQEILEANQIGDLKRFIDKRQCLNTANMYMIYLFHFVQAAGVLTTSVAAGYSFTNLIWVGVGLNVLATLIHVFEQTNNNISKKLLQNIEAIKDGSYTDEDVIVTAKSSGSEPEPLNLQLDIGQDLDHLIGSRSNANPAL